MNWFALLTLLTLASSISRACEDILKKNGGVTRDDGLNFSYHSRNSSNLIKAAMRSLNERLADINTDENNASLDIAITPYVCFDTTEEEAATHYHAMEKIFTSKENTPSAVYFAGCNRFTVMASKSSLQSDYLQPDDIDLCTRYSQTMAKNATPHMHLLSHVRRLMRIKKEVTESPAISWGYLPRDTHQNYWIIQLLKRACCYKRWAIKHEKIS